MSKLDDIFAPIQAEYDGGESMLPGTIPQAKQQIKELYLSLTEFDRELTSADEAITLIRDRIEDL